MEAYTTFLRERMPTLPRGHLADFKLFAMLIVDWIRKHKLPKEETAVFQAQEGKHYQRLLMDMEAKFGKEEVDLFLTPEMFRAALARAALARASAK
jgi:hypothetical protein